jgi:hypothetical protein
VIQRSAIQRSAIQRRAERGSLTLFGLGLVTLLLFVGGFSLDLWRAHSERRALAELADAAAAAGANAIDEAAYRSDGSLVLDPLVAEAWAWQSIAGQADQRALVGTPLVVASPEVIVVQVEGEVEMTLLQIFAGGEPFAITVTAEAAPARGLQP